MKRLSFLLLITLVVFSCKKNESKTDTLTTVDSSDSPIVNTQTPSLKEYTVAQLEEKLQSKNDTLYVTNFFATWCGPCIRELPHFTAHMKELEGKKVKFTFVSLDEKEEWETKVPEFVKEHGIAGHSYLIDGYALSPEFYSKEFKTWDGSSIPFTFFRQGEKTEEIIGMMTKERMQSVFDSFQID